MIMLTPKIFGVVLGSVCISGAVGMVSGRHQLPPAHQCQTQFGAADVRRDNLEPDVGICPCPESQTTLVLLGQTLSCFVMTMLYWGGLNFEEAPGSAACCAVGNNHIISTLESWRKCPAK